MTITDEVAAGKGLMRPHTIMETDPEKQWGRVSPGAGEPQVSPPGTTPAAKRKQQASRISRHTELPKIHHASTPPCN